MFLRGLAGIANKIFKVGHAGSAKKIPVVSFAMRKIKRGCPISLHYGG